MLESQPHVQLFWEALRSFTPEERTRLLTLVRLRLRFRVEVNPNPNLDPNPNPKQERRLFLTFVWGRNRLPLTEQDWGDTVMRVHELNTAHLRGSADQFFPVSHTCSLPSEPGPLRSL